jgi:hypothetical protein
MHMQNLPRAIAAALSSLASIAFAAAERDRAARLWAAAERLYQTIHGAKNALEQKRYMPRIAVARSAASNNDAFDLAWAEGRAMRVERAVQYALHQGSD